MDDTDRYIEFMEKEAAFSDQERVTSANVSEFNDLMQMVLTHQPPNLIEPFIMKNVAILFNYAPHTTLQVYISLLAQQNKAYELVDKLQSLQSLPELPAKAFSIINAYISFMKDKEKAAPSSSFASDDKILSDLKEISPEKIATLIFCFQTRLQMGEKMDHFVDLLNPFMMSPSSDPLYKLTLLGQIVNLLPLGKASRPFTVYINGEVYYVILDGSLDEKMDPFIRAVEYYGGLLHLPSDINTTLNTFAHMYRILHYNYKNVLNSELDVKSFASCLIEAYNHNVEHYGKPVFPYSFPESYREANGFKEAGKFLDIVFKPRYM